MRKNTRRSNNRGFVADASQFKTLQVESVDLEGQGVARNADGKVVFIEGAILGERVIVQPTGGKSSWETAHLIEVLRESPARVRPKCPSFGLHHGACGGCKLQHIEASAQVAIKARTLEDNLWHIGKVRPDVVLRPIQGPDWGYRYRGRLSVKSVKNRGVLVGFHERKSGYVADMPTCAVLPPHVSALLVPLRELIGQMSQPDRLPQIELAIGDHVTALVLRHMEDLTEADLGLLRAFAATHSSASTIQWWLQSKGPDTVKLLDEGGPQLAYTLSEFGINMPFKPTDFTQVNHAVNDVLVGRALRLLEVQANERVIDWFCGLGNFTLPLATQAAQVLGIEGSASLVARAQSNSEAFLMRNGPLVTESIGSVAIKNKAIGFVTRNLFEMTVEQLALDGVAQKWLIDPPREGAVALIKALADWHQAQLPLEEQIPLALGESPREALSETAKNWQPPKRIVYVSCNPSTLARDAGLLVHGAGYRCTAAGAINMFPHTAHVESIAVFERIA